MTSLNGLIDEITQIGVEWHSHTLVQNAQKNLKWSTQSMKQLRALSGDKAKSAVILSAGPSLHRRNIIKRLKESRFAGTIVAVDASLVACLKQDLIPDFVVTLDPHPTRMVRWYGDPKFEEHSAKDDYFLRQDLDVEFRRKSLELNDLHIKLVNEHGHKIKALTCSTAPENVVDRLREAKFDSYWWNPLVDDTSNPNGLTRQMYGLNKLPCYNTGGNVGTASWVLATQVLKIPNVALTGMDFGYHHSTPLEQTQLYFELLKHLDGNKERLDEFFPKTVFPVTGEGYYTDPTYSWYKRNFFDLLALNPAKTVNCTEGGVLVDEKLPCTTLENFINEFPVSN